MAGLMMEQLFFPEAMISATQIAEAGGFTLQILDMNNARVQVGEWICYLAVARALSELGAAIRQLRLELGEEVADDE
ncbi:hypothetical protein BH10CHL1_BH10CHL1_47900 [soil metagenome]